MKSLLLVLTMLLSFNVNAETQKRILKAVYGTAEVYISNQPCTIKELAKTHDKAALLVDTTGKLKPLEACWTAIEETDMIQIRYSLDKMDFSDLPADLFLQPHSFVTPKPIILQKELDI